MLSLFGRTPPKLWKEGQHPAHASHWAATPSRQPVPTQDHTPYCTAWSHSRKRNDNLESFSEKEEEKEKEKEKERERERKKRTKEISSK